MPVRHDPHTSPSPIFTSVMVGVLLATCLEQLLADTVLLKSGVILEGEIGTTSKIGELAENFASAGGSILIVDDGLRRVFVDKSQVANLTPEVISEDIIRIDQPVSGSADMIGGVGVPLRIGPFDALGRRVIVLAGPTGPREFIQGITKISPTYCVLEALTTKRFNARWESRIATSSVPREVLSALIRRQTDAGNPNDRIKIVQLFIEAQRYQDAVIELDEFLEDFPDLSDKRSLAELLRQAYARQVLAEIRLRKDAGQLEQSRAMMRQFPTAGIAGDLLGQVLELRQEDERLNARIDTIRIELDQSLQQVTDSGSLEVEQLETLQRVIREINTDLRPANVERMAGYFRFRDDAAHSLEQKLAFAVSGWLLGEADPAGNLQVAISQVGVRDEVYRYLSARLPHERDAILADILSREGASVENLAKIIANLKPTIGSPRGEALETTIPGCFEVQTEGERPCHYWVQLPPEYDPYRRYPCIVTLASERTPLDQIDWWSGTYVEGLGQRVGQATRHGYIVIAPVWRRANQMAYEYSPQEHAAVLDSLRDAMRRYAIDTDRVFLSGHAIGGNAAWDIALAHPDLWAGLIGITAEADKYVNHYHPNAFGTLPMYFVHGDLDHPRMAANKMDWNRYFKGRDCDVMVVSYQGRGREHFQEEVPHLFTWMARHRRANTPSTLDVRMMRPWDRMFWWIEVRGLPERTVVLPAEWPVNDRSAAFVEGTFRRDQNQIVISKCSADRATLWLNPDIVDFARQIEIRFKGDSRRVELAPDAAVLLEDVRRRGDRQRPFWAQVELPQ